MTGATLENPEPTPLPAADERTYVFQLLDVEYREILDEFSRQSGLAITGEVPRGVATFNCGREEMSFPVALNRLRLVLFKHPHCYWIFRRDGDLEVVSSEGIRPSSEDAIFTSLDDFLSARSDDDKLALLLYTPDHDALAGACDVTNYLPNYVRVAPFEKTNSMTFFGIVKDIWRYVALAEMLSVRPADDWVHKRIDLQHAAPADAVRAIQSVFGNVVVYDEITSADQYKEMRRRSIATTQSAAVDAFIWVHEPCRQLVIQSSPPELQRIEDLLKKLDHPSAAPASSPAS